MTNDVEKNRLLDEISNLEIDMRCIVRKMTVDSTDPAFIKAMFYPREADEAHNDGELFTWKGYFVKFVSDSLAEDKGNLDFLLEEAAKSTKQAMLKEYFLENPKGSGADAHNYENCIDLLVSECIGMYTPAGAFGCFIETVMDAVREARYSSAEFEATLNKLKFMLDFKWRSDPKWKTQEYMGIEFGLGYLLGLVTPAISGADQWGNIEHLYPKIKAEINSAMQSQRGQKKGSQWGDGMALWVQEKIKGLATKNTKAGLALSPSNRAFALSIKSEAMNYRYVTYGSKWTNEQAAFEWIQKIIKKILNP